VRGKMESSVVPEMLRSMEGLNAKFTLSKNSRFPALLERTFPFLERCFRSRFSKRLANAA
jgi:hypothetical protein